jgi:hypothetical protein
MVCFNATTYPEYSGRYVITSPDILARQTITISAGASQLYLQLNEARKLEVLPDSPVSFFLLGYGGLEFSFRFTRDPMGNVNALAMEGGGLRISATKGD